MTLSNYEPSTLEIRLTLALGLTILSPYYRGFARALNLRGDERVLDFGSGSGVCSRHIAARLQHGGWLDCVDISQGWMNVIRKTLRRYANVGYHLGPIGQLGLPAAAFDLVVVHFVLHDIPPVERQGVVQALAKCLKSTGRLVLREPQGTQNPRLEKRGVTPEELHHLAANAGLAQSTFSAHKIAIGGVYDACFVYNEEIL